MKEFSDSLPASELEHFWLNMFDYLRKYICVHASSINLMKKRTRQQQFPIFFTSSLFISVTKNFSFNILKTISLKIEKKTNIEAQSEGHALVDKTSESHFSRLMKTNPKKILCRKQESRTGGYWPSVVFVRTSLCSVRTVTNSGQYSPVRPSRSVSKRLVLFLFRFLPH